MASNKEENTLSARQPFFIATDEGMINSEHVVAIFGEMKSGTGKYKGKRVTALFTDSSQTNDNPVYKPYVLASEQTVRNLFEKHGYHFIDESALEELEAEAKADNAPGP